MGFRPVRKFTDDEFDEGMEKARSSGASLGRLRSGRCEDLEALADEMIRRSLTGVTKYSDKSDILTPWKLTMRQRREVLTSSGFPDAAIRKGMYKRAANTQKLELNCLAGETKAVVRDRGVVPIEELEGTTQEVLTSKGWGKGEFRCFGEQVLWRIDLHQGRAKKSLFATDNHRWFVYGPRDRSTRVEVQTRDLLPEQMLVSNFVPCGWKAGTEGKFANEQHGWMVDRVSKAGIAPVYCAVVPSTQDFTLEDYILTGNSRDGIARARTKGVNHYTTQQQYSGANQGSYYE
jgi:hypothetical protein